MTARGIQTSDPGRATAILPDQGELIHAKTRPLDRDALIRATKKPLGQNTMVSRYIVLSFAKHEAVHVGTTSTARARRAAGRR